MPLEYPPSPTSMWNISQKPFYYYDYLLVRVFQNYLHNSCEEISLPSYYININIVPVITLTIYFRNGLLYISS